MSDADLTPVSAESSDGRILTGVGTTVEALHDAMERHEPDDDSAAAESIPAIAPPSPEAVGPAAAETPKPSKGRQRYAELTQRAAQAERERDELKARIDALSKAPAPAPAPAAPAAVSTAAPVPAPKFTFPSYEAAVNQNPALTWDEWNDEKIAARARWEYQQANSDLETRVRQSIEADRASRALADSVEDTFKRGRAAYADFDAVRKNGPGAAVNLGPDLATASARIKAIIALPYSEHVQYAIGKDAALAARLAQMSDVEFGMALASLAPATPAASSASTGTAGIVMPPAPYQPVGSGSKTTAPPSSDLTRGGFDFDKSGYREKRAAERGVSRRR